MPACLQLACHMYRRGKGPGGMLNPVSGFAISGKLVRVCTTIARGPMASLLRYGYHYSRLRLRWSVGRDKTCKEVSHCRGCGSMQYVDCYLWAMFIHRLTSATGEGSVPLQLGPATYCTLADSFGGLKGRGRRCKMRHVGRISIGMDEDGRGCG